MSKEPSRSPERQRLAAAIRRHADAVAALGRIGEAQERLEAEFFDVLVPAVPAARAALEDARVAAPAALVDRLLGDAPGAGPSLAEAEAALAEAEKKLADGREARSLLAEEAARAETAVNSAQFAVGNAIRDAVASDPSLAALRAEFTRSARRALRCLQALFTAGHKIGAIEAHGLRFAIGEAAAAIGQKTFFHDSEWTAALAALRDDPDAALPGLPEPDPDDAGDGDSTRAAA